MRILKRKAVGNQSRRGCVGFRWITLFIALWSMPVAASAVEVEKVTFAETVAVGETILKIRGYGLHRYMVFIKAYVGALYLPAQVNATKALDDIPKRLEISYFHSIQGDDFAAATKKGIQKNRDPAAVQRLLPAIEKINRLYQDVRPGDRYTLTYLPGKGTELALNGTPLGSVPGAAFASAMFSIWLGENPIDRNLKQRLMGKPR